jgi:hypothetical protein
LRIHHGIAVHAHPGRSRPGGSPKPLSGGRSRAIPRPTPRPAGRGFPLSPIAAMRASRRACVQAQAGDQRIPCRRMR